MIKIFLKVFFPYVVKGRENLKKIENRGLLICSNHVSNLDALFIVVSLSQKVYFLAKSELFKNFVISYLLRKLGAISISRGKHDTKAIDKAKEILLSKEILAIFIEGTRSKTGKFLRPHSGAAIIANDTNSTILPICITPSNSKDVKMFHKTNIVFGNIINEIKFEQSTYKEIRDATETIMENIKILRNNRK